MIYVEWLRVLRCLKWTAIVLGVMGVVVIALDYAVADSAVNRIALHGQSFDQLMKHGVATRQSLPGGVTRTIVDDPANGTRITVDDRGYFGKHIQIFMRTPPDVENVSVGPVAMHQRPVPGGTQLDIDTNEPQDLAYYFGIAGFVALIVASFLGAPFARENDGHLEVALTKPVDRIQLGLSMLATDAAGILGAWCLTVAVLFIVHVVSEAPNYVVGPNDGAVLILGILGSIAWYAMLAAATAAMKRGYNAVQGIAWPIAILVVVLARVRLGDSALAGAIQTIAKPFAWIDPFNYVHFGVAYTSNGQPRGALAVSLATELPSLLALALVYGAIAILVWRRVEA